MAKQRKRNQKRHAQKERAHEKHGHKKHTHPMHTICLVLAFVLAASLGTWFAITPTLERNRQMRYQAELLAAIEDGDGVISVNSAELIVNSEMYDTYQLNFIPGNYAQANNYPLNTMHYTLNGIGILTIERIDARLPVTAGASAAQLDVAVGHVSQTPQIGSPGNAVIAGHRSFTHGRFFNRLDELALGDVIGYRPIGGQTMEFEVFETLVVLPGDPVAFYQPVDESIITLLTCTPIHTATHRLLVRARRINY